MSGDPSFGKRRNDYRTHALATQANLKANLAMKMSEWAGRRMHQNKPQIRRKPNDSRIGMPKDWTLKGELSNI